jgi:hypothetical protein
VFRRKKNRDDDDVEVDVLDDDATTREEVVLGAPEPAVTRGPWDPDDVPDPDLPRLDLGGLLVPIPKKLELQVEANPDGTVAAAVVADGRSTMQLNAFAAPRRSGLWEEVRTEIRESLDEQGIVADEADGPIGRELRARIPTGDGKGTMTSARFIGCDGPRWFLRGLISGPAATDPVQAEPLEAVFRGVVVVRGGEAMAPRDQLPLRLPKDVPEPTEEGAEAGYGDLDPFERGPEITEIH